MGTFLKTFFRICLWLLVTAVLAVSLNYALSNYTTSYSRSSGVTFFSAIQNTFRSCSKPLTYTLGGVDPKFHLSTTEVQTALAQAEGMWEIASGKDLFTYSDTNPHIIVELIYDYRQEATDKLKTLGLSIDSSQSAYDALEAEYTKTLSSYSASKDTYETKLSEFETKQQVHNNTVEHWNSQGGAPADVAAKLNAEKNSLDQQLTKLEIQRQQLNDQVANINAMVTVLNKQASELNLNVQKYNQIGESLPEGRTVGEYSGGYREGSIQVFEFKTTDNLKNTLAHELGHSLGLDHVLDKKAIMYADSLDGQNITPADLTELSRICKF